MPKTVYKTGGKQTINIHIHEKSNEKKRRQKRRKVSRGGSIRTINRMIPAPSELPQRRLMTQQLVVLPEGDKALGQVGGKPQLTFQKELIRQQIKEYEDEVRGKSIQERELPITPATTKPTIRRLADLKDVNVETILKNRKAEAIQEFNINTEGLSNRQINKKIREAHALVSTNPLTRTPKKTN